jgi:hypothetical protein
VFFNTASDCARDNIDDTLQRGITRGRDQARPDASGSIGGPIVAGSGSSRPIAATNTNGVSGIGANKFEGDAAPGTPERRRHRARRARPPGRRATAQVTTRDRVVLAENQSAARLDVDHQRGGLQRIAARTGRARPTAIAESNTGYLISHAARCAGDGHRPSAASC